MARSTQRPRRYSSVIRSEQAELTRQRVLDAAAGLFVKLGYAGTTITAVAAEAGVSPETIYATFDSKRGLLEGVIDGTIMGPGSPVPLEEQSVWDAIAEEPDARERLRAYVEFSCGVLSRTSPIHQVIRGAADSESFAVELSNRLLRERLASNVRHLRDYVGADLREGLTLQRAAERYCAITSPEMHHLLTVRLGWSRKAHQEWVVAHVVQDLLGPD